MSDVADEYEELLGELREFAESVLTRVEPALRRAATGVDLSEWSGCDWCPVCAGLALLRGERHELLSALADHGVTVVTVLREALAGMPVDPVTPDDDTPAQPGGRHRRTSNPNFYQPIPVMVGF